MKILLATNNLHKAGEFRRMFASSGLGAELITIKESGFAGEINESAETFEGNAYIKARTLCDYSGLITIADDSGLCVDALGGAPGVHSSRFAGEPCDDSANNAKLLKELENVPDEARTAKFVCVICAVRPDGKTLYLRGETQGVITRAPRGAGRFGYDPLFYYPPANKTFAEMDGEEKDSVSHRGKAIKLLAGETSFFTD
ncbi:MAG: RdgB/HAM1 family non-canonical purine NTP pyrophosphatase [Clostridia bacterium]|nr:RdgB/HAM1 family non-canonical purine NTP pyrophosphatase [Clostridia bacterium]